MAIKISGTTVIDDSRNLVNINSGLDIRVEDAGSEVGTGITTLNFVGDGNSFSESGGEVTITISGDTTTGVTTAFIFSNPSNIASNVTLNDGNNNYGMWPCFYQQRRNSHSWTC